MGRSSRSVRPRITWAASPTGCGSYQSAGPTVCLRPTVTSRTGEESRYLQRGEQYNGGCFTDWKPVGDTLRLPKLANPRLLQFGRATEFRDQWAWHPAAGEDDHDYIGACQRAELAHDQPQGMTAVDQHMSFVFVESCLATGVDPGRAAVHELGHFMAIRDEVSDDHHPAVLSHPFDHEQYGPTFPEDRGCLMDYKADLSSTYCEFCVNCIETVRGAGTR